MREKEKADYPLPDRLKKIEQLKQAHIELDGNYEMILDGCKGILEYSEEKIKICADGCTVSVSGDGLLIKNYNESQIDITGKIVTLDFS